MSSTIRATYVRPVEWRTEVRQFYGLIRALVERELKGRYRRSVLGPAWAVLQPLAYMIIFTFMRSVLNIPSEGYPYVVFTFTALVPWTFFANSVSRCAPSVTNNASLVKKISTAREVFPVSAVVISAVDFMISFAILAVLMVWYQTPVGLNLLWLPVLMVLGAVLAFGVGIGMAAVGTYRHDVNFVIPLLMQMWLFASPIMYPISLVPERWRFFYQLNPMVGLIEAYRSILLRNTAPDLHMLGVSVIVTVLILCVTWPVFRAVSQYFADVL